MYNFKAITMEIKCFGVCLYLDRRDVCWYMYKYGNKKQHPGKPNHLFAQPICKVAGLMTIPLIWNTIFNLDPFLVACRMRIRIALTKKGGFLQIVGITVDCCLL